MLLTVTHVRGKRAREIFLRYSKTRNMYRSANTTDEHGPMFPKSLKLRKKITEGWHLPLYEYRCTSCGHTFEKIQSFSAEPERVCPRCGGELIRPVTAPALRFEGAGWYVNDYAGKGGAKSPDSTGAATGEEGGKDGGAESKPAASESSPAPAPATTPAPAASTGSTSGS